MNDEKVSCKRSVPGYAREPSAGCGGGGGGSQGSTSGSGTPSTSGTTTGNVIKIGVFEPFTGDSASGGKKEYLGMQ